jgi:cell division protein FtsL
MKSRFLALWTVAVFATGAAFVTYLALRFEAVRIGYELDEATKEQKRLTEWKRMVALEAQTLREHQRVEAIAQRSLHMAQPAHARIVSVEGGTLGQASAGKAQ